MEAEQLLNMNHIAQEKLAPVASGPVPISEPSQGGFTLDELWAQREQLIAGLSTARSQLETQAQSVARTEGALMMTNQMILKLNPDAFKQQQGG